MGKVYSTYEAKARFSEIMRLVRAGQRVRITFRGEEVAEIGPLERRDDLASRLNELAESGQLTPAGGSEPFAPLTHRPGGLERFLEERE